MKLLMILTSFYNSKHVLNNNFNRVNCFMTLNMVQIDILATK